MRGVTEIDWKKKVEKQRLKNALLLYLSWIKV